MFVSYHGQLHKVHEFINKSNGMWLDLNIGFLVKADKVDIVTLVTLS